MDLEDVRRAFEAHRMYGIGVQARMEWVDGVPRLHHGAWTEVLDIAWDRWLAATRAALRNCLEFAERNTYPEDIAQGISDSLAALGGDE